MGTIFLVSKQGNHTHFCLTETGENVFIKQKGGVDSFNFSLINICDQIWENRLIAGWVKISFLPSSFE